MLVCLIFLFVLTLLLDCSGMLLVTVVHRFSPQKWYSVSRGDYSGWIKEEKDWKFQTQL